MMLIIGGAYQGKRRYAEENYGGMEIVDSFHLYILELLKSGMEPLEYLKSHKGDYIDKVIIADDISSGIVPTDVLSRRWREACGHALAFVAAESEEVVRVFCGMGIKLK